MSSHLEQKDHQLNKVHSPKKGRKTPSLLSLFWSIFIVLLIFIGVWLKVVVAPPQSNVHHIHVDWAVVGVNEKLPEDGEEKKENRTPEPVVSIKKGIIPAEIEKMSTDPVEKALGEKIYPQQQSELEAVKQDAQQAQVLAAENTITLSQPGICIILSGVGLKSEYDQPIVNGLDPEINIAVLPFAASVTDKVKAWTQSAHEVITEIPMEPLNYPEQDPGANTLLTGLSASENISRLEAFLIQTPGVKGILSLDGTRFTAVRRDIVPIIQYLKSKNLIFVDSVATPRSQVDEVSAMLKSPFVPVAVTIPVEMESDAAWKVILEAAENSTKSGLSVVKIDVSPKRLTDLMEWQNKLKQAEMKLYRLSETSNLLKNKDENRSNPSPQAETPPNSEGEKK